ncbi:MAG: alpha/beta hydrolase fold domain-containing protein [Bryobacteraceae bacterium]
MRRFLFLTAFAATLAGQTADVDIERDIEFASAGGKPLLLDVYRPRNPQGKPPVIVSIHGGGWHGGSKEASPGLHFTSFGYAVVSLNYRLTGEAVFPAQIHDCKAAVRWVRANADRYGWNATRIGTWGASAGGHLAALLATSGDVRELEGDLGVGGFSSRVEAAVDFFGPIDVAEWFRYKKSPFVHLIGAPIEGNEDRLRAANPETYIGAGDPPVFVAHGAVDTLVPRSESERFYAALRRAGVPATLTIVPEAGHSVKGLNLDAEVRAFFDRYLR